MRPQPLEKRVLEQFPIIKDDKTVGYVWKHKLGFWISGPTKEEDDAYSTADSKAEAIDGFFATVNALKNSPAKQPAPLSPDYEAGWNAALAKAALTVAGWSTAVNYMPEHVRPAAGYIAERDHKMADAIKALKHEGKANG